jgi:hypothetical protein
MDPVLRSWVLLAWSALAALPAGAAASESGSQVTILVQEAKRVRPLFHSNLVSGFHDAVPSLPRVTPRTIYCDSSQKSCWTKTEAAELPDKQRAHLTARVLDETYYYDTRYGSPLAYARPLEIVSEAGLEEANGKKILDFGYGTIGHLRLLASLGAEVHGLEVDPLLRALYENDWGDVTGANGRRGRLELHDGQWPGETVLVNDVGAGYDLFLSKNTLKRGYIHPAQARMLVHLGVDDTTYVQALAHAVKPGGLVMIYNLCPAPAAPGKPYIPWADGRCPFDRSLLERMGLEVLAFDRDDTPAARAMAHALGWDAGEHPTDLQHDLFATYTLLRRKSS